jgi:CDP-diacylglycerol--glycerol-3-phosphate 3-phosphatidyltransferase
MKLTLPNLLTIFRIALIPVLFLLFWLPPPTIIKPLCSMLFTLAAITDWFDGYLARRLDQHSNFGEFLDPVADKLMVMAALILIVSAEPEFWMVIPVTIIIGREIVISALREWMAEVGKRAAVKVSKLGKVKTTFQMFAIGFLLWRYDIFGIPIYEIGYILLLIAAGLTIVSMLIYLKAAWPHIKSGDSA